MRDGVEGKYLGLREINSCALISVQGVGRCCLCFDRHDLALPVADLIISEIVMVSTRPLLIVLYLLEMGLEDNVVLSLKEALTCRFMKFQAPNEATTIRR